jgi:Uma2 family endonuclease
VTVNAFEHPLPWTELEYFRLRETAGRVELIDGCLLVGPRPGDLHQKVTYRLVAALEESAQACDLRAYPKINLRLGPNRVASPDLVVDDGDWGANFTWASEAALVGEVVSENTRLADRVLKRQLYAEAAIAWYLLVEPSLPNYDSVSLHLLRLAGDHYVKHAVASHGQTLRSPDPFPFELRTSDLVSSAAVDA